ncbi:uncharacterized protein V1510DRAFT_416462 [Dipodascopsis tothii]|uniref:uncharacterized protein n=1 Tax=Dipodascopsis tothii TaxID=44089 RepID=UPI0034CEAF06
MASSSTLELLLPLVIPFLIPRLIRWFQGSRAPAAHNAAPKQKIALTWPLVLVIVSLLVAAVVQIVWTLAYLPDNVFMLTGLKFQAPVDIIRFRLQMVRKLTVSDQTLLDKLGESSESRLLYAAYGPQALMECTWCDSIESYRLYTMSSMLQRHAGHIGLVLVATAFQRTNVLRPYAVLAAVAVPAVELYYLLSFDIRHNIAARTLYEVTWLFWQSRFNAGIVTGVTDIALSVAVFLYATGRVRSGGEPFESKHEEIMGDFKELQTRLDSVAQKLRISTLVKELVAREPDMRKQSAQFSKRQTEDEAEILRDPAVVEARAAALAAADLPKLEKSSGDYAKAIIDSAKNELR